MNFEEIQSVWNTPLNQLDSETADRLKAALVGRLRWQRRTQIAWLIWTSFLLALITIQAGRWMVFSGRFSLPAGWLLLPFLMAPWMVLITFFRRFLDGRKAAADASQSIPDALRSNLAENLATQARHKVIAALQLLFALMLPPLMHQLHLAGKASARELFCMAILLGGALAAAAACVAFKYFRVLRPEQERIESLLGSY